MAREDQLDIARAIAGAFSMTDAAWRRHANPWSVWTRVLSLPPLLAAIWSHHQIGWWAALPICVVLAWLWLNPRLFPPPASTRSWASRVTFGERVWLDRGRIPIPPHHALAARLLATLAGVAFVAAVVGAVLGNATLTLAAGSVSWMAKMWFADRMVWLYSDMIDASPEYRTWLY